MGGGRTLPSMMGKIIISCCYEHFFSECEARRSYSETEGLKEEFWSSPSWVHGQARG
jgi:hypothetical protein